MRGERDGTEALLAIYPRVDCTGKEHSRGKVRRRDWGATLRAGTLDCRDAQNTPKGSELHVFVDRVERQRLSSCQIGSAGLSIVLLIVHELIVNQVSNVYVDHAGRHRRRRSDD